MSELIKKYIGVRSRTEELCVPLKLEDYIPQPVEFVSPPKWHLAHTTWFFEEMILSKYQNVFKRYNKDFGFLFNSYYQTIGKRLLRSNRGAITRPGVEEVMAYRRYIDKKMIDFLELDLAQEIKDLVVLGLNHEEQHQELLLTDLKYTLGLNPTSPVYNESFNLINNLNETTNWIEIPEGVYKIGHDQNNGFCFDNELNRHNCFIHQFSICTALVTNKEFIEFIEDDGYNKHHLWLDEGWNWIKNNEINKPLYWQKNNGQWEHFTLAGLLKIDPNNILSHISFYEAYAFATWKGLRLPTEFEWEVASYNIKWGTRWEWTYSSYLPYPGFKIADGAVGEYNGKFMINQMVLRGGSVATAPNHSRNTYRNFFHPNAQWQFSGIRLAK